MKKCIQNFLKEPDNFSITAHPPKMSLITRECTDRSKWDENLSTIGIDAGLYQSLYWARVISKLDGATPLFLEVVGKNQRLIASLLIFRMKPSSKGLKKIIKRIIKGPSDYIQWWDGPVFFTKSESEVAEGIKSLLEWIDQFGKKHKIKKFIGNNMPLKSLYADNQNIEEIFKTWGYESQKLATSLIDLEKTEADLWMAFEHSARKSIKKAQNQNVSVKTPSSYQEVQTDFWKPYILFKNIQDKNFQERTKVTWDEDHATYYSYFVAKSQSEEVLGTLGLHIFSGMATEVTSALSPLAQAQKIPAQDLLHWHAIKFAKDKGAKFFNLAGVNLNPQTPKEEGIRRFKLKWGGTITHYNRFTKQI